MKRLHYQKYVEPLLAVLFIASIGAIVHEIDWLENTLGGVRLFWIAFGGGALLGIACAAIFAYLRHELLSGMSGPVLRALIFIGGVTLAAGFASGAAASLVNRSYAVGAPSLSATVKDKFYGRGQAQTPRLVIELDTGAQEHVRVDRPFWDGVQAGERVELHLCEGVLGYDTIRAWSIHGGAASAVSSCKG